MAKSAKSKGQGQGSARSNGTAPSKAASKGQGAAKSAASKSATATAAVKKQAASKAAPHSAVGQAQLRPEQPQAPAPTPTPVEGSGDFQADAGVGSQPALDVQTPEAKDATEEIVGENGTLKTQRSFPVSVTKSASKGGNKDFQSLARAKGNAAGKDFQADANVHP